MKTLKKYLLGAALVSVAALTGCKDKMVELNTNPAIVTKADPKEAFLAATRYFMYSGRDTPGERASTLGQVMQYFVASGGSSVYSVDELGMTNPWPYTAYWTEQLYGAVGNNPIVPGFGPLITTLIRDLDRDYSDEAGRQMYGEIRAIAKFIYIYHIWMNLDAMGTILYTEGNKNAEGIVAPKYDMYEDVYKELIETMKTEVIEVLKEPATPARVSLGEYDSFFGHTLTTTPGQKGAVTAVRGNPDEQRDLWLRFANTFRLKMGHRVYNVDATTFEAVLADYMTAAAADQVMTSNAHNCMMLYGWVDETYNNMDGSQFLRQTQRASLGFVNTLKVLEDPRLHLLVRTNLVDTTFKYSTDYTGYGGQLLSDGSTSIINSYDYTSDYAFMFKHFPDSLARFGDMMEIGNVYQGVSANPYAFETRGGYNAVFAPSSSAFGKSKVTAASTYAFNIENPNGTGEYVSPNQNNWDSEVTIPTGSEGVSKQIYVASLMQIRYFYRLGGNQVHYLDVPQPRQQASNNIDHEIRKTVRNTVYLMSYSEHCFRMAFITLNGGTTGKSAQQWFEDGIRANMEQLYEDALRVWVPVVWSTDYPAIRYRDASGTLIEGAVNGTLVDGVATITPYQITSGMIDAYIASLGAVDMEKLGVQAWIGMYQQPEEAWAFWKQIRYPRMLEIAPFSSNANVTLPSVPGMEKAYGNSGATLLKVQRRAMPLEPNNRNRANYIEMQRNFESAAWYEGQSFSDLSEGRAWWDQNNLDYVVD